MTWRSELRLPKAEIIQRLQEAAEGWDHNDKPTLAGEARQAIDRLEAGAWSARVGHIVYMVDDPL